MNDNIITFSEAELAVLASFNREKTQVNFNGCIFNQGASFPLNHEEKALKICRELSDRSQISLLVRHRDRVSVWIEELENNTSAELKADLKTVRETRTYRGQTYEVPLPSSSGRFSHNRDLSFSSATQRKYRGQVYNLGIDVSDESSVKENHFIQDRQPKLMKYRGRYINPD